MAYRPVIGRFLTRAWRSSGRNSGTWHLKTVLASLIVVGSMSYLTVEGVFAILSSESINSHSSIASGTLTFSNTVNANTSCYSYGAGSSGNVNSACDALFSSATLMYPGTVATAKVTIANNGSLDASDLSVYMPTCAKVTSPGAPSPGGANPCGSGGALFYIQETNSSWVPTTCWFPAAVGACSLTTDTLYFFANSATSSASALDLGPGPAHAASRYFIVGTELASAASNTLQGEEAQFDLTWHMSA
ncbi:MAG TPA: hypothetical protein VNC40_08330 [Gaiellaceae bacterium]|nr:hypothetical protein [Gaiellaceae bacterium]